MKLEYQRRYRQGQYYKDNHKFHKMKSKYGLTKEAYFDLLEHQKHCCKICGLNKTLVIDHCHLQNKVRGLLCHSCNKGLGHFFDNPNSLDKGSQYLREFLE